MYIIKRKRLSFIIICVLLAIFAYAYEGTKMSLEQEIQQTTATPTAGKFVVIDYGHGVLDE